MPTSRIRGLVVGKSNSLPRLIEALAVALIAKTNAFLAFFVFWNGLPIERQVISAKALDRSRIVADSEAGAKEVAVIVNQNAIPDAKLPVCDRFGAPIAGLICSRIESELFARLGWAVRPES